MMILLNDKNDVQSLVGKTNEFRVSTFEKKIYASNSKSKMIYFLCQGEILLNYSFFA